MIPSFAYYIMALRKNFIEFCNDKLQEIGLSQGQLLFLMYIGKHENCSPKELAMNMHMDNGHAARSIARLVEDDFISQVINPKDKRAHILNLTKKGNSAFQVSRELFFKWDEKIMQGVGEDQQKELILFLQSLVHQEENSCVR